MAQYVELGDDLCEPESLAEIDRILGGARWHGDGRGRLRRGKLTIDSSLMT